MADAQLTLTPHGIDITRQPTTTDTRGYVTVYPFEPSTPVAEPDPIADDLKPQVRRLVKALDLFRVPIDHGRDRAGRALTKAGITWRSQNLQQALIHRRKDR